MQEDAGSPKPPAPIDSAPTDPAPAPSPAEVQQLEAAWEGARKSMGETTGVLPEIMVRGGTTSGSYDKEMQMRLSEADERRAQDAAERHLGTIPLEQGGAMNFEHKFADPLESPRVLLEYVGWGKEVIHEQLCEMVLDDTAAVPHHILIFVCPECFRRGVPSQFAQIHVRDNHRAWSIDTRDAGEIKAVRNEAVAGGMEFFTYAGRIMDTDVLGCDNVNCGAKFKINKNRLYRVK